MKRFIYILGIVLVNLALFGMLFKIQHWPGAGILLTAGLVLFSLIFLPLAIINNYKGEGKSKITLYIAGFITAFIVLSGLIFKIQHWPGANILLIVGIPLPFILFLPVYIYFHNKEKSKTDSSFLGVMFLMVYIVVYSGLLAINVSKNILISFITYDTEFAATSEIYENKCADLSKITESSSDENTKKILFVIRKKADEIFWNINDVKNLFPLNSDKNISSAKGQKNKFDIRQVYHLDLTPPAYWMIGIPGEHTGEGCNIKNSLIEYRKVLSNAIQTVKGNTSAIDTLLNTADFINITAKSSDTLSWEEGLFATKTLASLLANLSMVQSNIRLAEAETISQITMNHKTADAGH